MKPIKMQDPSKIVGKPSEKVTSVVYGVYDSSSQPFSVRMNDFFIDRKKVTVKDKSYFYHLLGVMIDAGIPIMRALKVLAKKTDNPRFARIVNTMAYDVERGSTMSKSMTKFPDVFKESEIGVMRSGEAIGNLAELLFKLADQTGRTHELYMKVRGAMIYPATVLVALIIAGVIVISMVIPRLKDFFEQSDVQMPFLTRLVLNFGNIVISFGWLVLIVIVFLFLVASFYANTEAGKRKIHMMLLKTPWVSDIVRKLSIAQFVSLLSILVTAGVPINDAIRITGDAITNRLYRDYAVVLRHNVERGEKIAENLEKAPFLFPETVTAMISVGENTGAIGPISEKLASHYESEVEHSLENFTTLLEPIIIGLVGLAVAILALALLGPIFSLSEVVA
ncbi:type II secretion system F family protein [Patescibacteria group bacterium]|nr:type II secretion system F family protein [Patescibacteria group bacterium]